MKGVPWWEKLLTILIIGGTAVYLVYRLALSFKLFEYLSR